MKLARLAWRNIGRNRRRTVATVTAMTLALVVTVVYSALGEGYLVAAERDALDNDVASVQVTALGYLDHPSLYAAIPDAEAILKRIHAAGVPAAPRFLAGGLAAARENSAGVMFRGVDVAVDATVLNIHNQLLEGQWLTAGDEKGVVLGRKLAHTLDLKTGDEVILLSQGADGSMANGLFRVQGILRSVGDTTDRTAVFMTVAQFRNFLGYEGDAHQILVRRPDQTPLERVAQDVRAAATGTDVQTWRQLLPTLASMMDATRSIMSMLFFVIYVVVAIVVLNAMLMAVFERIREFGILKALGIHPGDVVKLILLESAMQVLIALVIGLALCVPTLGYLSTAGVDSGGLSGVSVMGMAIGQRWFAVVSPSTFVAPVFLLVTMAMLAVVYPALKAAWLRPVDAMRHT